MGSVSAVYPARSGAHHAISPAPLRAWCGRVVGYRAGVSVPRKTTTAGRLARMGFADAERAERLLTRELGFDPDGPDAPVVEAFAAAADPDQALAALARMSPGGELRGALRGDPGLRARLAAVLGASAALGDHLARHPGHWRSLATRDALVPDRQGAPGTPADRQGAPGTPADRYGALRAPAPEEVRNALLTAVGAAPDDPEPVAAGGPAGPGPVTALRAAYREWLLPLAARDLTGTATLDDVAAELADLAAATLEAALAIARAQLPPGSVPCRLAVIAMGKCGASELNYASDVDVIFVGAPAAEGDSQSESAALATATRLAAGLIRACSQSTPEGSLFPVDPNLRPEGRNGPLVRTLASHCAYYQRWAKTWEFQALLKARPVAGDRALGRAYVEAVSPLVWQASQRDNFVEDVQAMRRRVVGTLPAAEAGRQLKLGPGGLRDIEFAVQLLQLVHGRADESLREAATLPALAALATGGYVGRRDAAELATAYRFLRSVEHLLQLRQLRRTHTLPEDPAVLRRLGRALRAARAGPAAWHPAAAGELGSPPGTPDGPAGITGDSGAPPYGARTRGSAVYPEVVPPGRAGVFPGSGASRGEGSGWDIDRGRGAGWGGERGGGLAGARRSAAPASGPQVLPPRQDPADELLAQWRRHATEVRRLHEKLFYRPLLSAVARLPGEAARLTPQEAGARLEALGYLDPAGALRHIEALTSGVSRRSAIQRTLLPLMLGWFADAAAPDAGLLAFRQVSDALGSTPWFLRLLRDDMTVAQHMARLLASSRFATDLLLRQPEMVAILAGDSELGPRTREALDAEAAAIIGRRADPEDAVSALRALRRRELLRTAVADLLGRLSAEETGEALTRVASVTIEAALRVAIRAAEGTHGPLPTRLCVAGMGRFGGHETGYGSDADVMFVHDPVTGADERQATDAAHGVAEELRALLARPAPDPPLIIDPGLRPEGRQGPLVRTLASYRAYYQRWSVPWEAQALLRAEPVAGDRRLGEEFTALADEFRYPEGGLPDSSVREIRRIKARMEAERMPRGTDPALHLKLGPGGLADVEWVVQLLQLRHAHAVPGLRTTQTMAGLAAAAEAGLVPSDDVAALAGAWRLAARIRDAVVLVRGRAADVIPARQSERAAVASILGYPPGSAQELVQDYRRAARRSRAVMERLFYG
jgi:glutamine synthetase adenylyltransferase